MFFVNKFLWLIFVFLLIYAFLPTILPRFLGIGGIKHGPKRRKEIFLTFDDGPDNRYTLKVLAILKYYQIKAVFFVTGKNAQENPLIIKAIVQDGHHIGIHGMFHRFSWLSHPATSLREIRRATEIVYQITGVKPVLYRPPWGVFNLFNFFNYKFNHQRTILWSFMSFDWTSTCSADSILKIVRKRVKDSSIIILHDSAGPIGSDTLAPMAVIKALPLIVEEVYDQGYKFGSPETLIAWSSLSFSKRLIINCWNIWEDIFAKLMGIKPISSAKNFAFKLALRKYRGETLQLPDGTLLKHGDIIGELHFDNNLLLNITTRYSNPEHIATLLLRHVKNSLPQVAHSLSKIPKYHQVKAIYGITIIHRGAKFFGFGTYDLKPAIFRLITTWYQRFLLIVFHPQGISRVTNHQNKLIPKMIIISKNELLRRYCPHQPDK